MTSHAPHLNGPSSWPNIAKGSLAYAAIFAVLGVVALLIWLCNQVSL